MALKKVILANLRSKKSNFVSIFILIFIISVVLTVVVSVNIRMNKHITAACEAANIGDLVTYGEKKEISEEIIEAVKDCDEIENVINVDSFYASNLVVNGQEYKKNDSISKYNPKLNTYKMYNSDGISLADHEMKKPEIGEIYLPIAFKNESNCEIGDKVNISTAQGEYEFTITRFFEDPFIGGSLMGLKTILISDEDFDLIYNHPIENEIVQIKIVNIYVKDEYKQDLFSIKREVNNKSGIVDAGFYTMTKDEGRNYMLIFVNIINGVITAVAILLYIVIMIIIGNSVSTNIEMDYESFGIMKALGFTSSQIRFSIIGQYLLASGLSGIVGMIVGGFLIKYVNAIYIPVTGLCNENNIVFFQTFGLILVLIILLVIYVFIQTRKVTTISPMQAISIGRRPVFFSGRGDISITNNIPVNINLKIAVKQVLGEWKKYITTLTIMSLLVFFTMAIGSISQLSKLDKLDGMFGGYRGDISIKYDDTGKLEIGDIKTAIEKESPIKKELYVYGEYVTIDSAEILCRVVKTSDMVNATLSGRVPKYDNEIIITQVSGDEMGKTIGDTVYVKCGEEEKEFIIVGTYQDISDAGKSISMLESGFKKIKPDFVNDRVRFYLEDNQKSGNIINELSEKYKNEVDRGNLIFLNEYESTKEDMKSIVIAIDALSSVAYVLAFIFAAIVACMISNKNFMREQNDMGIYKSVGFTNGSLRRQFTFKYIVVVALGGVIGTVVNIFCGDMILSLLLKNMGVTKYMTEYSVGLVTIPGLYIIGCTALFTWFISGKIKKVSPKELIKE